jgi:hypothetical protein
VGPFRTALGGYRYILVVVDKFTKWIQVRAVAIVVSKEVAKFIEDITNRFGVPNRIVTDLGCDNPLRPERPRIGGLSLLAVMSD